MTCTLIIPDKPLNPSSAGTEDKEIPAEVKRIAVHRNFANCRGCEHNEGCSGRSEKPIDIPGEV